jgi:hypothetical protein
MAPSRSPRSADLDAVEVLREREDTVADARERQVTAHPLGIEPVFGRAHPAGGIRHVPKRN